jgi:uroporphyrin-III C-methyltransferase
MIYFVGAGPGDPELLTRKAWRLLGQAQIVLYDALTDINPLRDQFTQVRWISVGKRGGQVSVDQRLIGRILVNTAARYSCVVRLKGGDPSIFGRLAEEMDVCRSHGIAFEVVPGVTAASAASADLQTSLTLRGVSRNVLFVTPAVGAGQQADDGWLNASLVAETVVFYMAGARVKEIASKLIAAGKSAEMPVCLIENASQSGVREKFHLNDLVKMNLPRFAGPVILMMGAAFSSALENELTAKKVLAL